MKMHVLKWGNSFGIRLPKTLAKILGINQGDAIEMGIEKNKMIIKKVSLLEDLLSQVTAENIHAETDWGSASGKEIW